VNGNAPAFANLGVSDIRAGIAGRVFGAREIAEAFFERIEAHDQCVRAYLELTEREAFEAATRIDGLVAAGRLDELGPLAGVPVAFKDNMHMVGTRTSCASRMLEGFASPFTADCVQRMIDAGAIPLGKLNLDEFAFGSSTETSAFGNTRNPWDLERVPGGSSGGSVAAVAAGLACVSLGSDAGGSIRQPGAFCGVVALKPSFGTVSSHGVAAFVSEFDQVGPVARSVEDAAIALDVVASRKDRAVFADSVRNPERGLRGMRVGFVPALMDEPSLRLEVKEAVEKALGSLSSLGAELVELELSQLDRSMGAYYVFGPRAAYRNLGNFDPLRFGHRPLEECGPVGSRPAPWLCSGRASVSGQEPSFGAEAKRRIELGAHLLNSEEGEQLYREAQKARALVKDDYAHAFERVELVLAPVTPRTAFRFGELSDPHEMRLSDMFTVSANVAGLGAMSMPVGLGSDTGLPVGVQLIAPPMRDENMLRAAAALELVYGKAPVASAFA